MEFPISPRRVVAGNITGSTGAIVNGTGFSCVRNSLGNFTITFTTKFPSPPSVSVVSTFGSQILALPSVTAFSVGTYRTDTAAAADYDFSFIAILP